MAVEPALTAGIGARSQGGANATKNAGNGGVERENRADRGVAGALTHSSELYRTRGTHRARGAEGRGGAVGGRGGEEGAQSWPGEKLRTSRRWCAAERQLLRASEREGESASEEAQMAAGMKADAAGRSWRPTGARPGCRTLATRRSSSAGAPRRHGAAVRARAWRGRGQGGERGRAGPASASGPEVRPRPASAPLSFFYFFEFLFSILVLNSFGLFKNPFHL